MNDVENSGRWPNTSEKAERAGSLSAAQTKRIVDIISAARATLEDEVEYIAIIPTILEPKPSDQQHLRKLRVLTVSMRIMIITTVLLAFLVLTASLYLGRHSQERFWVDTALQTADITLGISAVAACVLILARNCLIRRG